MRYFNFLHDYEEIFFKAPKSYGFSSSKNVLSYALGATLYMSGTREHLLNDILINKLAGASSIAICLEDAVSSFEVWEAEKNIIQLFTDIEKYTSYNPDYLNQLPLIFIRTRSVEQLSMLLSTSKLMGLSGFIFPKFNFHKGELCFSLLKKYNMENNRTLYGMPILETSEIIHKETRVEELVKLKALLDEYKELVLNIRIGGTDFSGIYSLRRHKSNTIYDLTVISNCISDIINIFKREDYVISGAVYEYFNFNESITYDTFIKEIQLDGQNGLIGKTVIHPTQVNIVNSLLTVSKEDYLDAKVIISSLKDGVIKSTYSNKMNEVKPHLNWAKNILQQAEIMGVLNDGKTYRDILSGAKDLSNKRHSEDIIKCKEIQV